MNNEDISKACEIICDSSQKLRYQVAPLVYQTVFEKEAPSSQKKKKNTQDEEIARRNLRSLLVFIEQSLIPHYPNHVIEALWRYCIPLFTNWDLICEILLTEEEILTESQQMLLIRTLNASIKKAASKDPIDSTSPSERLKHQQSFTTCMIKALPELLTKFKTVDSVFEELIELANYMILEDYGIPSNKQVPKTKFEMND